MILRNSRVYTGEGQEEEGVMILGKGNDPGK